MSLMQPPIDELLEKTENDKFLLCAVASERARDINDMMRGQRDRAKVLNSATQIAQLAGRKPLSLAMEEIERAEISYDHDSFHGIESEEQEELEALEALSDSALILDDELIGAPAAPFATDSDEIIGEPLAQDQPEEASDKEAAEPLLP
jgi:DNA-directed RNA polymerase subunit omega